MDELALVKEDVAQLKTDMYIGRGQKDPPITLRLDRVEQGFERLEKNISKLIWVAVTAILGTAATFLLDVLWSHLK